MTCGSSKRSLASWEIAAMTERSGWEQHRKEQRRAWLRLSYAERLRWLENAKRFARLALEAARRRKQGNARLR